ncbi:DUF1007 family protein [Kiloniella sp.]|uniref:DUF1007 family protein n=1 Tax=Kiloniella sp. TaxID=1938587 RepID=UPI003B01B8DC
MLDLKVELELYLYEVVVREIPGPGLLVKLLSTSLLLITLSLSWVSKATAHPHVWVDAAVLIHKNDYGQIVAIEPVWIFDDLYTATLLPDLDKDENGDVEKNELLTFAKEAVQNLAEWDFFLDARNQTGEGLNFKDNITTESLLINDRLLLRFKLMLEQPIAVAHTIELRMYDPSYFVAIELVKEGVVSFLPKDDALKSSNTCQYEMLDPLDNENNQTPLAELSFSDEEVAENPELGSIFAQSLRVSCQ